VTLVFQYEARLAKLLVLQDGGPETYDLCGDHANRTGPPVGWTLQDDRPDDLGGVPAADDLASPQTVAVLAAALRRDGGTESTASPDAAPDASTDADPHGAAVDTAALDAIVDQALEDDDLLGAVDEPGLDQPTVDPDEHVSVDALTELSALSLDVSSHPGPDGSTAAGRTVPGAHRPD